MTSSPNCCVLLLKHLESPLHPPKYSRALNPACSHPPLFSPPVSFSFFGLVLRFPFPLCPFFFSPPIFFYFSSFSLLLRTLLCLGFYETFTQNFSFPLFFKKAFVSFSCFLDLGLQFSLPPKRIFLLLGRGGLKKFFPGFQYLLATFITCAFFVPLFFFIFV